MNTYISIYITARPEPSPQQSANAARASAEPSPADRLGAGGFSPRAFARAAEAGVSWGGVGRVVPCTLEGCV